MRALSIVILFFASLDLYSATFHVAVTGDDKNPGTERKPFATLARARDAVRAFKRRSPLRESVTVIVHGGGYTLTNSLELSTEDSGDPMHPVVWQSGRGEVVRFLGGPELSPNSFHPVADPKILSRLSAAARTNIVELKLRDLGITQLPDFPTTFRGVPAVPELFFNGQRMTLAHWPNQGWATIAKIIESGSTPRNGDNSNRPGTFEYSGDRPEHWSVDRGVWLQGYWCYDWYDETIRVKSIDVAKHQITLAAPALYSVSQGNPSPRRFRALNVLEELDQPGEFYIDPTTAVLYFWPPSQGTNARAVLSVLNAPLFRLTNAEHVTIRGFTIEASLADGIQITGGQSNRVENCDVRNTRQIGIRVSGGKGHVIESCDIHETGSGGLTVEGGDRKTLTPAGHQALNNHIWRFSRHQLTAAYGLILGGVGNRAAHNVLHDAPHQAIAINGNDHIFEFNVVSNVVSETDDAGALYKGRDPSCRGNVIRYNFWRDIGSPMGHGTAAIYFDDGDGGDLVFGNIFLRCGNTGGGPFGTIFSHGGHGSRAENNIFIDCPRALGSVPWDDQRWKDALNGGQDCHWQEKLLHDVDITKPPYTTHYPELIGFMDPKPGQPRNNFAKNNILIHCADAADGNWKYSPADFAKLEKDPGFIDPKTGIPTWPSDRRLFQSPPNFQRIEVDKIGFGKRTIDGKTR